MDIRDPRAWAAAQAIDKIVARWLEHMNLPICNEIGRDLFQNVLADVIENAYDQAAKPSESTV